VATVGPRHVALATRSDKVPWIVVHLVAVKVIGDQAIQRLRVSSIPGNSLATPMTRMVTGSDLEVQNKPMFIDPTIGTGQQMAG
jgi:hypothetical protein